MWTSWKMHQLLIGSHKQTVARVASRLPDDTKLYSEMMAVETGLQKAIDNLTTPKLLIWVQRPNGKVLAQSRTMDWFGSERIPAVLATHTHTVLDPQVLAIDQRDLILCGVPIEIQGQTVGTLYVAEDVTQETTMFVEMVRNLSVVSIMTTIAIALVIACYIERSLQPLREISQATQVISAEDLGQAQLQLDNAPSEVRELAQTFNMMLARLSTAWEQQRDFVSNVSHELRTPLTIVHGYLQSLQRRGQNLSEPQRDALEIAASETDRTIQLLQELLELARADSGYLPLYWEPLILNDLLVEVAGMAENFGNRVIKLEFGTTPIKIRTDRNRLKQILINLVDNAVKYSDPSQPVTLRAHQLDDYINLQVCDRGCGIPLQHQARIFERFYRVDEARARDTGSYGLGLSIVKTLVEGMGGNVTVHSKVGEGSIFTVTLPA